MESSLTEKKGVFTTITDPLTGPPRLVRIGVAFFGRNGVIYVTLDAIPVNGRLEIRDPEPPRISVVPPVK